MPKLVERQVIGRIFALSLKKGGAKRDVIVSKTEFERERSIKTLSNEYVTSGEYLSCGWSRPVFDTLDGELHYGDFIYSKDLVLIPKDFDESVDVYGNNLIEISMPFDPMKGNVTVDGYRIFNGNIDVAK